MSTSEIERVVVEEGVLPRGDHLEPRTTSASSDPWMREVCKECGHVRLWHFMYTDECTAGRYPNFGAANQFCSCKAFER